MCGPAGNMREGYRRRSDLVGGEKSDYMKYGVGGRRAYTFLLGPRG